MFCEPARGRVGGRQPIVSPLRDFTRRARVVTAVSAAGLTMSGQFDFGAQRALIDLAVGILCGRGTGGIYAVVKNATLPTLTYRLPDDLLFVARFFVRNFNGCVEMGVSDEPSQHMLTPDSVADRC